MPQGIGIRYSAGGVRILKAEMTDAQVRITGVAAGKPVGSLIEFCNEHGIETDYVPIVIGLVPGDFFSACLAREDGMDDEEFSEQLRWEVERKLVSPLSEYTCDTVMVNDRAFIFAGKISVLDGVVGDMGDYITDVEPIALFNGCDGAGETGGQSVVLVSVEAEGITTVMVGGGEPVSIESVPIRIEEIDGVLPVLDSEKMGAVDDNIIGQLAVQVKESVERVIGSACTGKGPKPEILVVAGGGACMGNLVDLITEKTSMLATASDPFSSLGENMVANPQELSSMGAAFTTCLGYALRAMEV